MPTLFLERHNGLGNQLFAAAGAFHYANASGRDLVLLKSGPNPHSSIDYDATVFRRFRIAFRAGCRDLRQPSNCGDDSELLRALKSNDDVKLWGFFLRADLVSDEFCGLLELPLPRDLCVDPDITLYLQIRGGDFRTSAKHTHQLDMQKYLLNAKLRFPETFAGRLLVFTNDQPYASELLRSIGLDNWVLCEPQSELQDLADMASGTVPLLISNSTFGWWAARIGRRRLFIAPKKFTPQAAEQWDCIYDDRFTLIDV